MRNFVLITMIAAGCAQGCGKRTSYLYVFGTGWSRNSGVLTN